MLLKTALFFSLVAAPVAVNAATCTEGIWLNPSRSVAVRTGACGQGLCGRVVWASGKALADAQDSGVTSLIGTELLHDYRAEGPVWRGSVYVPDMGRHFDSRIEALSPDRLKISGCILGGIFCRSQVWTRVAQVPA
ncbi:DUF2147 domain-containing protein [Novosphingobium guangzhouense]|uniref:DUF2147 domain-containing protein n=1 Tax=Novosphingobium guangzhouense TaxID=1850347 RepID=A0A2K2G7A0_9SPHN|nr:DUF2147 domain-containing protein [Novosphingobium guangzhouense]PNU06902.1 hypothetical protein A8V01_00795 [Novosphingobium guangzhouense]